MSMDLGTIFVMPRVDSVCVFTMWARGTARSVKRATGDSPSVGSVIVMATLRPATTWLGSVSPAATTLPVNTAKSKQVYINLFFYLHVCILQVFVLCIKSQHKNGISQIIFDLYTYLFLG